MLSLDRRTDEVQERVQVQDRLRRPADGHGASAGLRERRVGPGQGHQVVRAHSRHSRGSSHLRWTSSGKNLSLSLSKLSTYCLLSACSLKLYRGFQLGITFISC